MSVILCLKGFWSEVGTMKEPIFEVREKKFVLASGVICTIIFGFLAAVMVAASEGDALMIVYGASVFGGLTVLGIYLLLAYFNHRLKVFSGGELVYSNSLGKKTTFIYRDIVKLEQKYVKTTMSMILKDTEGKRLAKVESNMKGYDQFCQWLNAQNQTAEEAQAAMDQLGVSADHKIKIEPVKVKGTGKIARAFLIVMGVFMLIAAAGTFSTLAESGSSEDTEVEAQWFDPTVEYEDRQMVEFEMISYPFASFELNDSQGLYFVFDTDMSVYIVCLDNDRLETEFKEIYDYTFSDAAKTAGIGVVEGYAMPIEAELKAIAIEEFNYLWGSEVLTDANFADYIGDYYLDTTYILKNDEESVSTVIIGGLFFVTLGIYLIYYGIKGYKKAEQKIAAASGLKEHADSVNSVSNETVTATKNSTLEAAVNAATAQAGAVSGAGELPVSRNIFVAITASVICAAAGGLLWIVFYKLGRIAAISGYLAVFGAMWGYSKFGKRELKGLAVAWCILAGMAMIIFANYISYAWEIVDAINASNPGRAEFVKVFMNMPQMMSEWELWGSFVADLGMGIGFALLAGLSSLFGKKKK